MQLSESDWLNWTGKWRRWSPFLSPAFKTNQSNLVWSDNIDSLSKRSVWLPKLFSYHSVRYCHLDLFGPVDCHVAKLPPPSFSLSFGTPFNCFVNIANSSPFANYNDNLLDFFRLKFLICSELFRRGSGDKKLSFEEVSNRSEDILVSYS